MSLLTPDISTQTGDSESDESFVAMWRFWLHIWWFPAAPGSSAPHLLLPSNRVSIGADNKPAESRFQE